MTKKKVTLVVARQETPDQPWEEHYELELDEQDLRAWGESTVKYFNDTMRPGDKPRVFVDIRFEEMPDEA